MTLVVGAYKVVVERSSEEAAYTEPEEVSGYLSS